VLAAPHLACHEIAAAYAHRRHPLVALIRESKSAEHDAIKRRWYEALGMETVHRARNTSPLADVVAMLRVLRAGRVLAVTPDVLVSDDRGVRVRMFGHEASLAPGIVVLAQRARAPLVTGLLEWEEHGPERGRLCARFTEPLELPPESSREQLLQEGMQRWCGQVEGYLRSRPENWLFWLDKRWTRVLRGPVTR
jgi:lauroyl/myristoyl acyltransferase